MDLKERAAGDVQRHPWEVARARFFRGLVGEHVDLARVHRVLDVGAGDGWFAEELLADLPATAELVCWDANYRSRDLAAPAGERIHRQAHRPDRPNELVLALDVIEHVEHDEAFLVQDLLPLVAPGGCLVVSVPAHPALFSEHDRMLEHHRRYRPRDLRALMERHTEVVARGSLFTTLLAPRAAAVLAERLGRGRDATGVGTWTAGPAVTAAVTSVLQADAAVSGHLARHGLALPGLSTWVVARA